MSSGVSDQAGEGEELGDEQVRMDVNGRMVNGKPPGHNHSVWWLLTHFDIE